MLSFEELQEKIDNDISEDEIIAAVMKAYPDLYDMLDFNEFTLKEKAEKNAYWQQQFRILLIKEKHKLKKLELKRDEYIGKLYHSLKYEGELTLTKTEIEHYYIPKDTEYIRLTRLFNIQSIIVETFDAIKDAFKAQNFNMKTFVENMKL